MSADGKLTDEEKLYQAREYKERGNTEFRNQDVLKAMGSYHRALLYLKGLSMNCPNLFSGLVLEEPGPIMSLDMKEEARVLTCECYNNLAACLLKEPDPRYDRILEYCNKALELDPGNDKALYRKGKALLALCDYEEALITFEKSSSDASLARYINQCKAGLKKQETEMKERYKNMFQ